MDTPQFPGFEIIETLPRGGMSTVYKARQVSLDRIVALKTLPLALAAESADINQFLAEARITANLKHPNIVQVYDFGKTESGVYYFVMEFISGYNVGDWIRRKQRLSEKNALLVAQSVAEALGYAWKTAGVVHCDIKPDNLIIDGDGTVKVADLGLAKSVRSVIDRAKVSTGMVFGTPNYISPEQSRGDADLDCRTDIYSLGATLYHGMTGKMPFEGAPALTAMDLQITDQIPDAQDVNPSISTEAAVLLEKMLAKDRAQRPADWESVLVDISRVMQHQLPEGELPLAGASTMRRSAQRGSRPRVKAAISTPIPVVSGEPTPDSTAFRNMERQFSLKQKRKSGVKPEWWFAGVITLAVLILGILVARSVILGSRSSVAPDKEGAGKAVPSTATVTSVSPVVSQDVSGTQSPAAVRAREENAREMFEFARKWAQANPARLDDAIRQYKKVANETRGTKYSLMAMTEIQQLVESKQKAADAVMRDLETRANPLIANNEFARAVTLYEQYQGDWAAETAENRDAKVRELSERDRDFRDRQQQSVEEVDRQWRQLIDQICARLVEGDVAGALAPVEQAAKLPALAFREKDVNNLATLLTEASRMDQRILDAYRALKDKEVKVILSSGAENMTIRGVRADKVQAEKIVIVGAGHVSQSKFFRVADLALSEKRLRLGSEDNPETALMQGLLSIRERDWPSAESYFAKTDPLLTSVLIAKLGERKTAQTEDQARRKLLGILRNARIEVAREGAGCEDYLAAIPRKAFTAREAQLLAKTVDNYRATFGQTRFARQYEPVLDALADVPVTQTPERTVAPPATSIPSPLPQPPVRTPPPALKQQPLAASTPEGVKAQMLELNPGMDVITIVFRPDESGKITRVEIFSPAVKNIRPLAALPDVREILCAGCSPQDGWQDISAPLVDLFPLKGLPLRELDVSRTMVRDIAPLVGMPLTKLSLAHTKVTEITCLNGLPLTDLNLRETRIRDIGALRGMPLKHLILSDTEVADITPLKGMPLERLNLARTQIRDLTPLNGMRLIALDIEGTGIKDCAVLKSMPLRELSLSRTKLTDFTFLSDLPLANLNVSGTEFRDFSVLKGMPLKGLDISGTKIKDRDLVSLQELPLEGLNLSNTEVKDLTPLKNLGSLRSLNITQTQVKDLTPIQDMPIESLWLDYNALQPNDRYWVVMRRMPNLGQVNGQLWGFGGGVHRRR